MRLIGHIDTDGKARTFGDYLYVKGIDNQIEREPEGNYAVWINDEDKLETARQLLQQFEQDSANPEYKRVGSSADEKRLEVQKEERQARRRIIKGRQLFPSSRGFAVGPVTFLLIAVCAYIAFISKLGGSDRLSPAERMATLEPIRDLFISDLWTRSRVFLQEFRAGEVWRIFTPMLVHFSFLHIFGNMSWLLFLGSMIEDRKSSGYFLLMVLVISGGSNVVQLLWTGSPYFGGMSGVVYGLFGYVLIRSKLDIGSEFFLDRQSIIISIVWLFLCLTGMVGPIANAAHFGGLFIGLGWGYVDTLIHRSRI